MKKTILKTLPFLIASTTALAGPIGRTGPQYRPIQTCNHRTITLFDINATDGVLALPTDAGSTSPLRLIPVTFSANAPDDETVFTTQAFGTITIDSHGHGQMTGQSCTMVGNVVTCGNQTTDLECEPVPPVPGGFSAGN